MSAGVELTSGPCPCSIGSARARGGRGNGNMGRFWASSVAVVSLWWPSVAHCGDPMPVARLGAGQQDHRNYANLRVGASNSVARPLICLDIAPSHYWGLEACGTGAGLWHATPQTEVAQFRGHLRLANWPSALGWLQPRATLGFVELQQGQDAAGFDFFGAGGGIETAGPEAGLGARMLTPLAAGVELVTQAQVSVAWLPHAGQLRRPVATVTPTATLSIGIGF